MLSPSMIVSGVNFKILVCRSNNHWQIGKCQFQNIQLTNQFNWRVKPALNDPQVAFYKYITGWEGDTLVLFHNVIWMCYPDLLVYVVRTNSLSKTIWYVCDTGDPTTPAQESTREFRSSCHIRVTSKASPHKSFGALAWCIFIVLIRGGICHHVDGFIDAVTAVVYRVSTAWHWHRNSRS